MQDTWQRLETWLKEKAPEMLESLAKGANSSEIEKAEQTLNVKFPQDFAASYQLHNGQDVNASNLLYDWQLLPLEKILDSWKFLKELSAKGTFKDASAKASGSVKAEWWNSKWIPVGYNESGDYQCLDLDPPTKGKVGQIVTYYHDNGKRKVVAASFKEWLESFAKELESNKYIFDKEYIKLELAKE